MIYPGALRIYCYHGVCPHQVDREHSYKYLIRLNGILYKVSNQIKVDKVPTELKGYKLR